MKRKSVTFFITAIADGESLCIQRAPATRTETKQDFTSKAPVPHENSAQYPQGFKRSL
jgi:hypothetical protein